MRVLIVFAPDAELIDPTDPDRQPISRGMAVGDNDDAIVITREWGDDFEGGYRDHLLAQGVWENLTIDQFGDILGIAGELPDPDRDAD